MFTLQESHELRDLLSFGGGRQAVAALQRSLEFSFCPANNLPLYKRLTSTANPVEQLKYRSGSCSQAPLECQPVTFETGGKEMKAADTVADLGKKLRKSVKQGYHPNLPSFRINHFKNFLPPVQKALFTLRMKF